MNPKDVAYSAFVLFVLVGGLIFGGGLEETVTAAPRQEPQEDALGEGIPEGASSVECGDDCIEFVEGYSGTLEPAGFRIVIVNRKWAEITPDGNVVCYNTLGQPEACDCIKMLIAYMAATMNR